MRKMMCSCIDNKTRKEIVYTDISDTEAFFELETITDITDVRKDGDLLKITTPRRIFWYDFERRYLLGA